MEERLSSSSRGSVNYYSILKDIARQWLTILLITLSMGLLTHVVMSQRYHAVYATRATLVVTKIGVDNNAYANLRSASDSAKRFSLILNSSVLQKMVAEEIGLSGFQGTAEAQNISNTNLLVLTVRADSPSISFREMKSILQNYTLVSKDLMDDIHLTILEAPEVPDEPESSLDNRNKVSVRAMMITAALMILLMGFFSAMRDTVRSNRDVELKLAARRLATVYHEKKYKSIRRWRKSKKSILITDPTTSSRYVETFRKLANRVINRMDERGAKTLIVTSVMENEGKTTVAANLALAMSQQEKKVLIIDADFRKPALYLVLNRKDAEFDSLSEALSGNADMKHIIQTIPGTQLYAILNKTAYAQSMEMFSTSRIRKIIESCRNMLDYVVVDTPPMQLVADAEELAALVDASILCVKQHMVEAKDINDAIDVLNGDKKKVLGVILNDARLAGGDMSSIGHSYGYEYGGR